MKSTTLRVAAGSPPVTLPSTSDADASDKASKTLAGSATEEALTPKRGVDFPADDGSPESPSPSVTAVTAAAAARSAERTCAWNCSRRALPGTSGSRASPSVSTRRVISASPRGLSGSDADVASL